MYRNCWVLHTDSPLRGSYVRAWHLRESPEYTGDIEKAKLFPSFDDAMVCLITHTYMAGKTEAGYNSSIRPAKVQEKQTFTSTPAGVLLRDTP